MISICIPIYNFNVSALVLALESQIEQIEQPVQIVLIDDASSPDFKALNEAVCSKHYYIKLDKNVGRAAIRNLFVHHAKHEHLLFLDCDSLVEQPNFVTKYIEAINRHSLSVICGGRIYSEVPPTKEFMLRWKYGLYIESKTASQRAKQPNRSFMTNNFVVQKSVLQDIGFDERLRDYGHEDTLFGFELKQKQIKVFHIENPVLNGHLENNQEYLDNTEKAIENLLHIMDFSNHDKQLVKDVTLLRIYHRLKPIKFLLRLGFLLFGKPIKKQLTKGNVNLFAFNFYKLGYLASIWK